MPRAARANAHLRVADWIDSLPPDRAEDRAEMLAHHLVRTVEFGRAARMDVTTVVPRAAHALRKAGDRSWSLGAPGAALELYERARVFDPAEADDPYLLFRFGRALAYIRGEGDSELERTTAALAEIDPATAAEAELLRGEIVWQRGGEQDASFAHFERAGTIPNADRVSINPEVVAFAAAAALMVWPIFGLIPAWRSSSRRLRGS